MGDAAGGGLYITRSRWGVCVWRLGGIWVVATYKFVVRVGVFQGMSLRVIGGVGVGCLGECWRRSRSSS